MTLADLRDADALFADLLLEQCGGRHALAAVLIDGISRIATERERARVAGHLKLGSIAGLELALEAIKSGASINELGDSYVRAAIEVREARAVGPQLVQSQEAAKELLQETGDGK